MRIAIAQINATIGDFSGNVAKVRQAATAARSAGADLVVCPELVVCGYPPMDLLDRPSFRHSCREALDTLAAEARDLAIVVGAVVEAPDARPRRIANAAVAMADGRIVHVQWKTLLPTYDVFDEARYFAPAEKRSLWTYRGRRIGLSICEDAWGGEFWGEARPYRVDPLAELAAQGAEFLVNVSASPFEHGKVKLRESMLEDAARRHQVPIVFANLVGGNDELIFDGSSFVVSAKGQVVWRMAPFEAGLGTIDLDELPSAPPTPHPDSTEMLERALVLGIRDYMHKQGLGRVVVGLSGGIDSAVTAHLAVEALGAENVAGILMPGPFSSEHSIADALSLCDALEIESRVVRIDGIFAAFIEQFRRLFGDREDYGVTQENLQARVRGTLLMAVSNFEDRIVLATGNKSELSVGYTTLYGDLVGGVAVIGDVLKRDVYALARRANRAGERVPWSTIEKPPSAELRPDQRDTDSLPEYAQLDETLHQVLERGVPAERAAPQGVPTETVRWVLSALDRAEYKRRQAPIVLRVSPKAFGTGRRIPIVQRSGWGL